jgi:hypothetical protein
MSEGMDLQFVRENYRRMSDDELIRLATLEAGNLTPEAQAVIKEEINRRNLGSNIIKGVEAQHKSYTLADVDGYCELIRNLECPVCGSSSSKLNATTSMEVKSFIVFTHHRKETKVACPDCLNKQNNSALLKSVLLGWWGLPWGIVRTIQAINLNLESKKLNKAEEPNKYLRAFTLARIGKVEAFKDNKEELQEIIKYP